MAIKPVSYTDLGISLEPRPNHAAYLDSWLEVMKSHQRALSP